MRARSKNILLMVTMLVATMFLGGFTAPMAQAADASSMPASVTNFTIDDANVLSSETEKKVRELNDDWVSNSENAQLLVVTQKELPQGYDSIEDYSMALAEKYRLGDKKKDTGLVYTVITGAHNDRLEVGYGLEGKIPDSMASDIISDAHPSYKDGDWDGGVLTIISDVKKAVGGEYKAHSSSDELGGEFEFAIMFFLFIIVISGLFLPILIFTDIGSGYSGGSSFGGYSGGSSFSSSSSSGSSFGGGSFGGGGASGSW